MPTVRTPGSEDNLYNFGPASSRDNILFSGARPGNSKSSDDKYEKIADDKIGPWIDYMKGEQGIAHVLVLLDDNELESYEPTGLASLYVKGGLKCSIQPMKAPGAAKKIFDLLDSAESTGEKVVAHCTGGTGRSGRVCAGWLVHKYGLSPEEATEETMQQALASGVKRKGDVEMLTNWINASN